MPEPVILGLIAAASAIVGGVITAIARPWGQDYVNRKAEERTEIRRPETAAEERRYAEITETRRRQEVAEERERAASAKASEDRKAAIRTTREQLSEAWRNTSSSGRDMRVAAKERPRPSTPPVLAV